MVARSDRPARGCRSRFVLTTPTAWPVQAMAAVLASARRRASPQPRLLRSSAQVAFTTQEHSSATETVLRSPRRSNEDSRARLYSPTWADFGRHATSSISEQIANMMSTTEKAIDLDSIRQRLDRL